MKQLDVKGEVVNSLSLSDDRLIDWPEVKASDDHLAVFVRFKDGNRRLVIVDLNTLTVIRRIDWQDGAITSIAVFGVNRDGSFMASKSLADGEGDGDDGDHFLEFYGPEGDHPIRSLVSPMPVDPYHEKAKMVGNIFYHLTTESMVKIDLSAAGHPHPDNHACGHLQAISLAMEEDLRNDYEQSDDQCDQSDDRASDDREKEEMPGWTVCSQSMAETGRDILVTRVLEFDACPKAWGGHDRFVYRVSLWLVDTRTFTVRHRNEIPDRMNIYETTMAELVTIGGVAFFVLMTQGRVFDVVAVVQGKIVVCGHVYLGLNYWITSILPAAPVSWNRATLRICTRKNYLVTGDLVIRMKAKTMRFN